MPKTHGSDGGVFGVFSSRSELKFLSSMHEGSQSFCASVSQLSKEAFEGRE